LRERAWGVDEDVEDDVEGDVGGDVEEDVGRGVAGDVGGDVEGGGTRQGLGLEADESVDEEGDYDDPYLAHVPYTPRGATTSERRRDAALNLLESTGKIRSQLRRALSIDEPKRAAEGVEGGVYAAASGWEEVAGEGEYESEGGGAAVGARTPGKWQLVSGDGAVEITSLADAVRQGLLSLPLPVDRLHQQPLWEFGKYDDWEEALRLYSVRFSPWGRTLGDLDRWILLQLPGVCLCACASVRLCVCAGVCAYTHTCANTHLLAFTHICLPVSVPTAGRV